MMNHHATLPGELAGTAGHRAFLGLVQDHPAWCDPLRCQRSPGGDVVHRSPVFAIVDEECDLHVDMSHDETVAGETADWISLDVYDKQCGRAPEPWPVLLTLAGARQLHAHLGALLTYHREGPEGGGQA